jgi:hypothetical protein
VEHLVGTAKNQRQRLLETIVVDRRIDPAD